MEKHRDSRLDTAMDPDLSRVYIESDCEKMGRHLSKVPSFDEWSRKKCQCHSGQRSSRTKFSESFFKSDADFMNMADNICGKGNFGGVLENAKDNESYNSFIGIVEGLKEINTGLESLDRRVEELMEERKKSLETHELDESAWPINNYIEEDDWAPELCSPERISRPRGMGKVDLRFTGDKIQSDRCSGLGMCESEASAEDMTMEQYFEKRNTSFDSYDAVHQCYMWGWFCRKCGARDLKDCYCNNGRETYSRSSSRAFPVTGAKIKGFPLTAEPIADIPPPIRRTPDNDFSFRTIARTVASATETIVKSAWTWFAIVALFAAKEYVFRNPNSESRPKFDKRVYRNMINSFELESSDDEFEWDDIHNQHLFRSLGNKS